jgi:hypothetical protein
MTDSSNVVGNSLALGQRQVPVAGKARLDLVAGTASLVTGNLEEDRGIMVLEAKLSDSERNLEFRIGLQGMQSLGRIFRESVHSEPAVEKQQFDMTHNRLAGAEHRRSQWRLFETCVRQVLVWQDLVEVGDTLRDFGTRTKGTVEDQKAVLDGLRLGFNEQVGKIVSLLETRADGLQFLRYLLGSKHENMIRLGVFLMPSLLQSAVQDDLLQLVRERRLSRNLHTMCLSLLSPEARAEHLRSRHLDDGASGASQVSEPAAASEPDQPSEPLKPTRRGR